MRRNFLIAAALIVGTSACFWDQVTNVFAPSQVNNNGATTSTTMPGNACSLQTVAVRIDPSGPTSLTLGQVAGYTAIRQVAGPVDAPSACQGTFTWTTKPTGWAQILGDSSQPTIQVKCLVPGHNALAAASADNGTSSGDYGVTCQ